MAEYSVDRFVELYARRSSGMSASEVRALFAVASRPEVVSLAGGMPFVQALPNQDILDVVAEVLDEHGSMALQYGGGQGHLALRERLLQLMTAEGVEADPDDMVITAGAQQALDLVAKIFVDPGDEVVVEAPAYVGALSAFRESPARRRRSPCDGLQMRAACRALDSRTRRGDPLLGLASRRRRTLRLPIRRGGTSGRCPRSARHPGRVSRARGGSRSS